MQAVFETLFDIVYLSTVITLGYRMIRGGKDQKQYLLFGVMAVVLGCGDAFHLIPRAVALCTTGLESYPAALGIGKLVTSITMTVFYLLLYYVWRARYRITGRAGLTAAVWALSLSRILLCLAPQNRWTSADAPLSWGIYRQHPLRAAGAADRASLLSERQTARGPRVSLLVARRSAQLRLLPSGRALCRRPAAGRHADDPQNLRLRLDGRDGLPGDERRTLI